MLSHLIKATIVAALLAGCSARTVQTTSGTEYLARYAPKEETPHKITRTGIRDGKLTEVDVVTVSTDDLIRQAASVEPLLRLPARIGLARIENGALTTVPAGEASAWAKLGESFRHLGTLAPVDPFIANYVQRSVLPQDQNSLRRDAGDLLTKIRLGAARQHMDAVLIYEVGSRGARIQGLSRTFVLGAAPLPATPIEREGVARAFLMDVRNGYPYGTASASTDLEEVGGAWWQDAPRDPNAIAAKARIARALMPEVGTMFTALTRQMQTRLASARR